MPSRFTTTKIARDFALYETIETHHRGLQAIGIDSSTYSTIVVPAVIHKLPEATRLAITRGKEHCVWTMDEMLKELRQEIELREHFQRITKKDERQDSEGTKKQPSSASALVTKTCNNFCAFCTGNHAHQDCKEITCVSKRKQLVRKYGRCFICLRKGHLASKCTSNFKCNNCEGSHHSSICDTSEFKEKESTPRVTSAIYPGHVGIEGRVALQTAQAVIKGKNSKVKKVRVMFDSGSHRSFVTSKIVNIAKLSARRKEWVEISTFGEGKVDKGLKEVFSLELFPVRGGEGIEIEVYEVPTISQIKNEHPELRKLEYPHLQGLWFSDVCSGNEILEIDILIGADYLWYFQQGRTIRGSIDEPVAVETSLGWVLSGPMKGGRSEEVKVNFVGQENLGTSSYLESCISKLWDLDTLGVREEHDVHNEMKSSIRFSGERYQVSLPWKEGHQPLPSNYENSYKRLKGQLTRLKREPEVLQEYDKTIKEQLDQGIIEPVIELEKADRAHYLPHHAVIRKEAKTTKLRIVYDASSKSGKKGVSLNDCLHVGPPLSPLLYDILLRLRKKRIVLVGDIEKAFLNIEVSIPDRDSLRFLWVADIDKEPFEPVVYRFCRVVFGVNCSPFLLNGTLQYHLDTYTEMDPEFVREMKKSFYVDDLVSGEQSLDKAFSLYLKAKTRLAEGGFKLRKWRSNSSELKEKIENSEVQCNSFDPILEKVVKPDDVSYAKATVGTQSQTRCDKVLGLPWNCESDTIHFNLIDAAEKAEKLPCTKRAIITVLAGLFDPLGVISPVVLRMKVLFQKACKLKVDWDKELTGEIESQWKKWVKDLRQIREIVVPRGVHSLDGLDVKHSLHGFADASSKAYCAVVYFVSQLHDRYKVALLTSKTRVAPLKVLTIPRLELMAARMLAKLVDTVQNALNSEVEISELKLWSDSKTTLCWIDNRNEWKQFVRHRVNEILQLTNADDWGYCPGEENPADIGSRGMDASSLRDSYLWWTGPNWLSNSSDEWPVQEEIKETTLSRDEMKKCAVLAVRSKQSLSIENIIDIKRYSTLGKLLAVTSWVRRFVYNLQASRKGKTKRLGQLSSTEISEAERVWIKQVQVGLRGQSNYDQIKKELDLVQNDGIVYCKGRLTHSDLHIEAKEPIILPKDHVFTELIVLSCHKRVLHCGLRHTLAELRSKYWVVRGRQVVKRIISKCTICKKYQGRAYPSPPTAALPEMRVQEAPAFSKSGVDFAGPLFTKSSAGVMEKAYIVLWTCCVTRAVSLDLVKDMSASAFVCSLRRFCARHGTPSQIISDNAKTFKATIIFLRKLQGSSEVQGYLQENRIDWKFILERTPWWGGFYERMVGSVKKSLRKVLGNSKLSYDELYTIILEIEGTLNSRPLTYEYNEVGGEVLTPAHLIFGRKLATMPDEVRDDEDESENGMIRRFRYLARLKAHFWNRWRKEYLVDLRESHKNIRNSSGKTAAIGDVVLVEEEKVKRGCWKLAVVEELVKGRDEEIRGAVVRVLTKGKPVRMKRPVQKLYPLEVQGTQVLDKDNNSEEIESRKSNHVEETYLSRRETPRRKAAAESIRKTRALLDP